jgi:glutathione S-transferase
MKLYGVDLSPFARKVEVVLRIKGLDFESVSTMPGCREPDFLEISPLGKIPALVDGDIAIADSTVICEYLEEKYPEVPTMPTGASDRARARWLEEYGDTVVLPLCSALTKERLLKPALMNETTDETVVAEIIEQKLPPVLDYLEGEVPSEGFLFGPIGTADISIATNLINANNIGYQIDRDRHPRLAAFLERVKNDPRVKDILVREQTMLDSLRSNIGKS